MTASKKDRRNQVKALKKAHEKRAKLISKVAKARKKFETRYDRLQVVENLITELSAEVFGTAKASAAMAGVGESPATQNTEEMAAATEEHPAPSVAEQPATIESDHAEKPPAG